MDAQRELVINPDERAVEACLLNEAGAAVQSQANAVYFEPQTIADVTRQGRLLVLAEGSGGSHSGHVASQYAVQKILHSYYASSTPDPKTRLLEAINQANTDILERNRLYPDRRPMVATVVAALIHNNKLVVASIGDNRVYVVWDQDIELLAPGPSLPPAEPPAEVAAAETAAEPAAPIQPLRAPGLGTAAELHIETSTRRLFPGDVVILSSGGLTGYLQDKEMARAVNRHPGDEALRRMLALAAERGYHDSGAIAAARILPEPIGARPPAAMPAPAAPDWSLWEKASPPAGPPAKTTATRPMDQSGRKPQFKRPPGLMPDQRRRFSPKLVVALVAVVVLVLCAIAVAAARFLLPQEMLAAVPLADRLGLASAPAENSDESLLVQLPSPSPTAGPATNTPAATPLLVAEANSPLATPAAAAKTPASDSDVVSPVATPTPTPTPLPLPTIVLPAGCENRGRFDRDVTIPDGTQLAAGEKFEKTWQVQNAGDCPWGPGFTVQHLTGDPMGAANILPLRQPGAPGEAYQITLPLIAPAKPGTYRAAWQLHDLNGQPFGPEMYLEIEVTAAKVTSGNSGQLNVLYDFVANAANGDWSAGDISYAVQQTDISETLELTPAGLVAVGPAQLRGNKTSPGSTLLTYPNQETGTIEGKFRVDTPLQPTDTFAAELGFTKLSILSDDGVTFEVTFTPDGGPEQTIFSAPVQYRDSPVLQNQPLSDITPGATGTFTLRVLGGNSVSQDWALWINARLVRP